ncbi:MAG: DUF3035 domain-containing protein, partial [Bdellovibrionales bacterium]
TACSETKEKLGLGRKTPDEFAVIKRAPLEVPPDLRALPVPQKGIARPQEGTVQEKAQEALFGEETAQQTPTQTSRAEQALLAKTDADNATPNIRTLIDEESEKYANEEQAVIDKLLKRKKEVPGATLDAREEMERLKEQQIPTPNVPPLTTEPND